MPSCTSTEVLQEILHRYRSIGVAEKGFLLLDAVVNLGIPILPVRETDLRQARALLAQSPSLSTRDAVHAGVMLGNGITRILSYDRGFSAVANLERLEP